MNFLYDNTNILPPGNLVDKKTFPSLDLAKKYCNKNEYCRFISFVDKEGNYTVWIDYNKEIVDTTIKSSDGSVPVMKKDTIRFLSEKGQVISINREIDSKAISAKANLQSKEKIKFQLMVESESNCMTIIYKCSSEEDKNSLNFSKASIHKVLYSTNPFIDFSNLQIENGLYIARLVFFIQPKSASGSPSNMEADLGIYIPYTQVAMWLDNKMIHVAGNEKDTVLEKKVNLADGIHSIFIDFSFDTTKLSIEDNGVLNGIAVVPLIRPKGVENYSAISTSNYLYDRNPLLLKTIVEDEKKKMLDPANCNHTNFFKKVECMEELNSGMDLDLSNKLKEQFLTELNETMPNLSSSMKNLITFLYGGGDVDYDTARFMKDRIESVFVDKFLNMSWSKEDITLFSFLLPVLSPLHHNYILRTEVMQKCSDINSSLYKDGFCSIIESDITLLKGGSDSKNLINNIVDRRDYIYCTDREGVDGKYNFESEDEKTKQKCNRVIGDEKIKNYLISSKCSDVEGKWIGLESCKKQSTDQPDGIVRKDRDAYYRNVFSSKDNINKFYGGGDVENMADFLNYTSFDKNELEDDYIATPYLMELCENSGSVIAGGVDNTEESCKKIYDYVMGRNKSGEIADKLTSSIKKWNSNKCEKSMESNSLEKCDKKVMFGTNDPVNTLLYSSHVKKYCNKNPFDNSCVKYYEDILNSMHTSEYEKTSSMENKEEKGWNITWKNVIYFALVLIAVLTSVSLVFDLNKYITLRKDSTNTSTNISANI